MTPPAKCSGNDQCAAGKEQCDIIAGECIPMSPGIEIGKGDGTAASVTFTTIHTAKQKTSKKPEIIDLAFNSADPTELWVIGYGDDYLHVGKGVTADANGTWTEHHDPAAPHFMHKPPAIAMGEAPLWGTCGDNDNSQNDPRLEPNFFMGPAMMTTDMTIFTKPTAGGLGSHYDMLHNTTNCRGMAWQSKNIYWTFNGQLGSIEKYDFGKPHEPGGDDHSDGSIWRFAVGKVKGVEGIASHLAYDPEDSMLYIADTGNGRIVRLDPSKGTEAGQLPLKNELLKKNALMTGSDVEEIVAPGKLEQPSGIEVKNNLLYVTDTATGTFYVFDKTGREIRKLATDLPAKSLAGFTFGPDGKIFFVDRNTNKVVRIDVQ